MTKILDSIDCEHEYKYEGWCTFENNGGKKMFYEIYKCVKCDHLDERKVEKT